MVVDGLYVLESLEYDEINLRQVCLEPKKVFDITTQSVQTPLPAVLVSWEQIAKSQAIEFGVFGRGKGALQVNLVALDNKCAGFKLRTALSQALKVL